VWVYGSSVGRLRSGGGRGPGASGAGARLSRISSGGREAGIGKRKSRASIGESADPASRAVGAPRLAAARAATFAGSWVCLPHNLSKNNGCPLTPCSLLKPQAGPQTPRTGLLYCTPKDHASCEVNLWELCPGGSKGQTVRWTCGCEQDGSFACTPEPQHDASCP